ncbi:MAG: hypothetical protein KHX08_06745 [Clostridiales bacterium]|nr:hypothetical protein [Clostridiales bacterium]
MTRLSETMKKLPFLGVQERGGNSDPGRVFYLLTVILVFIGQGLFIVKNRSVGQKD